MGVRETATRPLYRFYENRLLATLDRERLPRHIGVIHDGHRRYARSEGLPDYQASYRVGMTKFVEFLHWSADLEIPAVTCWLLSKENLARPDEELNPYYEVLMELFEEIPNALRGANVGVRFGARSAGRGGSDRLKAMDDPAYDVAEESDVGKNEGVIPATLTIGCDFDDDECHERQRGSHLDPVPAEYSHTLL